MEALKAKRGYVKAALTRIMNYANSIPDTDTISLIEKRRQKLDDLWADYHNIQDLMVDAAKDLSEFDNEADVTEFESNFFRAWEILDQRFRVLSAEAREQVDTSQFNTSRTDIQNLADQQAQFLERLSSPHFVPPTPSVSQLPKITIKHFSGDFTEWTTFRDLFESSVHNNPSLTACQKFYHLKTFLIGDAATLLTHMPVTDNNYVEAWDKLVKRYDKRDQISFDLVKKFFNLPSCQSGTNNLRKLVDGADEVLRALKALGPEAETRDIWLLYLVNNKLDSESCKAWAEFNSKNQFPKIQDFLTFLDKRCDIIAASKTSTVARPIPVARVHRGPLNSPGFKNYHTTISSCPKCNSNHDLFQCPKFAAMTINLRRSFVKNNKLCFNCLRSDHRSSNCSSTHRCRVCNTSHHTMVHPEQYSTSTPNYNSNTTTNYNSPDQPNTRRATNLDTPTSSRSMVNLHSTQTNSLTFQPSTYLPTAVVNVRDQLGVLQSCRVLIDTGSQCSFISEKCLQRLGLPREHAKLPVSGISATGAGVTRGAVALTLLSRCSDKFLVLTAYVLPQLTSLLPNFSVEPPQSNSFGFISLADPDFSIPQPIDIIIGADKAFSVFENERIAGASGTPSAVLSIFGWIIVGPTICLDTSKGNQSSLNSFHISIDLDVQLQRFWELEEVTGHSNLSIDEQFVEDHFVSTKCRSVDGKYIVELPFKIKSPSFGNTINAAVARQKSMERKFQSNAKLKKAYSDFMAEYLALDHMTAIHPNDVNCATDRCFYLPHHAVFKDDSSTTKLRVVFDGSVKCSKGHSLNDSLSIGPPIQRDLFAVCTRFRRHKYCFSADIKQMFRQIWIADHHRDFQRIIWRTDPSQPFTHFRLNTVTYGTSPAPFLSVRTLMQLAKDIIHEKPAVADVILHDFYVDDILSGADTVQEIVQLKNDITSALSSAGFHLRKWSTNCWPLLATIPEDQRELTPLALQDSSSIKLLGLRWCPKSDSFSYNISLSPSLIMTKRNLLSEAARIFDPLGFLAPAVVLIKILFQEVWCRKLDWDDLLPEDLAARWKSLRQEIPEFHKIKIQRRIFSSYHGGRIEYHGFCDASEQAYAAVIYCRCRDTDTSYSSVLVAAKTKVAPLKNISLPRLELCGAVLLSRLFHKINSSFPTENLNCYAWTDSQIVLHWLSSPPRRWSTFIANRSSEILSIIPRSQWSHVKTSCNPADCGTRGLPPAALLNFQLWWQGPTWLRLDRSMWPSESLHTSPPAAELLEERRIKQTLLAHPSLINQTSQFMSKLLEKTSSWVTLYRTIAFVHRFLHNSKIQNRSNRCKNSLSTTELTTAKTYCIKFAQMSSFSDEIKSILNNKPLSQNSTLRQLSPFLDKHGLLRVGGRISQSYISYSAKHPLILPKGHTITRLIASYTHRQQCHIGESGLFAILRQQYWIFGCRNLVRKIVHDCVNCFKHKKHVTSQLMGDLPANRVRYARPFSRVGIDYAGPITIRSARGRNPKFTKGYICIFVCFTTRAIHVELANDLTTDCFLAALDRFCARRGKPSIIFSDNGTNFQGATRKLNEMYQIVLSQTHNNIIIDHLSKDNINWQFIPPASPHFGGLWEAGVKTIKTHLKRVIGDHILTYEELYTLLTRIESILNSRPLYVVSDSDTDVLTPAHFLIGEAYTATPEPDESENPSLHSNWTLLRNLSRGFWQRWHMEYLTSLQQRPKWNTPNKNLAVGDVVLLKESNLPTCKWILGKIVKVMPGTDGYVRVATVKTHKGVYDRPIAKLAALPCSESGLSASGGMFANEASAEQNV